MGAIGIALGLICMSFLAGWILCRVITMRMLVASVSAVEANHAAEVKRLMEYATIPEFGGPSRYISPKVALKYFEPFPDDLVTLSHVGGMGGMDRHIKVTGEGAVTVADSSGTKQVATLSKADCADFFRKVLASGLAGYSEEAVELKRNLARPYSMSHVHDTPCSRFRISVPELGVNREFSISTPETELKNYPDIIEYRSAVEIEKEILSFVP